VTLAYDFAYQDEAFSAVATAPPHPARSSGSEIAAFNLSRTDWQPAAERRLNQVIRLQAGWDGHQGVPVNVTIANYAYRLLGALLVRPGVPLPSITPMSYGGLLLEWHRKGWDVEIEIDAPASHHIYTHELASGTENEFQLGFRLDQLRTVIGKIAG